VTISVVQRADGKPGRGFNAVNDATLVVGQTTLVPVEETAFVFGNDAISPPAKRIFLAVTPVFIPPAIPDLGLVPTTEGGFVIRGGEMLPSGAGMPGGATPAN